MTLVQLVAKVRETGLALPGAIIHLNGRIGTADENGSVSFDNVPIGTYEVTIVHPEYVLDTATRKIPIVVSEPVFHFSSFETVTRTEAPPLAEEVPTVEEVIEALEEIQVPEIPPEVLIEVPPEVIERITDPLTPPLITPPTVTSVPSLPWYAQWLQPIIDYLGNLSESIVNYTVPIFDPIATFFKGIPQAVLGAWNGFIARIPDLFGAFRDTGKQTAIGTLKGLAEGSPEWQTELLDTLDPMVIDLLSGYKTALDVTTYEKSPLAGEDAIAALEDMKNKLLGVAIANFGMHATVESGSLGQFEFMKDLDPMVTSKFGMDALIQAATMKPIEKAVLIPAEHEYNTRYVPEIPPYTDLINMVVKEVIDRDEFNTQVAKLGFGKIWATRIWDAHFIPPNYTQLLQAHYRGIITREELETLSVLVDLDPKYKAIWDAQIEVIPPYSELVNELVKEVIDQPTFDKYLQWHGYDKTWGKRIWDAHFIPPSLGDILTAWRRGLITTERVDELMILVDLDPRYKEIFDTRRYTDPTIRMGRYMFELGAIDEEGITDIVERAGYMPTDVPVLVKYLTTFQERSFRTRYLTALESALVQGVIESDVLTKAVLEAGYSDAVAGWMIKTADIRKTIRLEKPKAPKARLLTTAELKKAYIIDKIDADGLRMGLLERGYEIDDVDLVIELIDYDKHLAEEGKRVVTLSVSQMLQAYRYQEMTRDELVIKLQLRGLAVDEVETLVKTKEKSWGLTE